MNSTNGTDSAPSLTADDPASPVAAPPSELVKASQTTATVSATKYKVKRVESLGHAGLLLRSSALLLSLVNIILLASNKHGDWMDFDRYQEYRYMLAVAVVASLYTAVQVARELNRNRSGVDLVPKQYSEYLDFAGDQVIAYLLISSLSSAIPITSRMRDVIANTFTDTSAASISLAFLAFIAIAASALLSGFKVSKQLYL